LARVLIVDDNRDTADSYAVLLRLWGHETRVAYNGESVLDQALGFIPHVAMLDLGLPDVNGYEVAKKLREYVVLREIKIIAVTGSVGVEAFQKCIDSGFDNHFGKPIDTGLLKEYLAQFHMLNRDPEVP
jgi:CheY-like chemotaxis protein